MSANVVAKGFARYKCAVARAIMAATPMPKVQMLLVGQYLGSWCQMDAYFAMMMPAVGGLVAERRLGDGRMVRVTMVAAADAIEFRYHFERERYVCHERAIAESYAHVLATFSPDKLAKVIADHTDRISAVLYATRDEGHAASRTLASKLCAAYKSAAADYVARHTGV